MLANLPTPDACATQERAYLWPCNVATWGHWQGVQTQWRVGAGGATGLDYAGVSAYLDESGMKSKPRKETFDGIRAAEDATLRAWSEKAKAKADNDKRE